MTKVTGETLTPAHTKAARGLLGWNAKQLAEACSVGVTTVRKFEAGMFIREASRQAIYDALIDAGMTFQNGGNPGVRLMKPKSHD